MWPGWRIEAKVTTLLVTPLASTRVCKHKSANHHVLANPVTWEVSLFLHVIYRSMNSEAEMLCGKWKVVREVLKISAHALSSESFSRPEGYYFSYKPTLKFITWLLRLNNEIKKHTGQTGNWFSLPRLLCCIDNSYFKNGKWCDFSGKIGLCFKHGL